MSDVGDSAVSRNAHKQALVRLLLGVSQMVGATAGLVLLLQTGVSSWTVGVVAGTGVVTLASRLLRLWSRGVAPTK